MGVAEREIVEFVNALGVEEDAVLSELFATTYTKLRGLAHAQRLRWKGQDTLSTTALVHEAYLKLAEQVAPRWKSHGHFFSVAARAMRHILINYAARSRAAKRGEGVVHISTEETPLLLEPQIEELLALDEALRHLERLSPRQARVVECRFFAGLDVEETAEALSISPATVKRDWSRGQAWLYRQLAPPREEGVGRPG